MADETTEAVQQQDGTEQLRDSQFGKLLARLYSTLPLVSGVDGWIDEYRAAQLGVYLILSALRFRSVDLLALVQKGVVETSRELEIQRVYLDYPDANDTDPPTPFAVIHESREGVYTATTGMHGVDILDGSEHVYGANTGLLMHGHADFEFMVRVFLTDKDDRAGLRKRLLEVFVTEPEADRAGRNIALPFYFDSPCRYTVQGISYPDDDEYALANRWPLVLRLRAYLRHVSLVELPPVMRVYPPTVEVE